MNNLPQLPFSFVLRPFGLFCLLSLATLGQPLVADTIYTPYNFTTLAGGGRGSQDGTGGAAQFYQPTSLAVDGSGNVYVSDSGNCTVRKITPGGAVTTLAGMPGVVGTADGTGSGARFEMSLVITGIDGSGNVYVHEDQSYRIITPGGVVTTIPDTTSPILTYKPSSDGNGNTYSVFNAPTNQILKNNVAIAGGTTGSSDGEPGSFNYSHPSGHANNSSSTYVAADSSGNVYVPDTFNETIRKVTAAGYVTTLGGVPGISGSADGLGSAALFNYPNGMAVGGDGKIYVADTGNNSIRVGTGNTPPVFTVNPVPVNIATGHSAAFSVAATGSPTPTYQWSLNGAPIAGATDPVLKVQAATAANAGTYTCTAANSVSTVTSGSAILTVTTTSNPGYLVNLSARAAIGTGNNILIGGFATGGSGTKQLVIRGAGPALSAFFSGALDAPQLTLVDNGGAIISSNIGWATAPTPGPSAGDDSPMVAASLSLMNGVGASPYQVGSADTAIVNISARANVGTGNNILIGGFAIGGSTAETVLIRAVGPGLNDLLPSIFPLSSVLNQPVLSVYQGSTVIYSNTIWGGDATEAGLFPTVGSFNLVAGHQDSVLLISLPPGNYTAQVSGLNSGTGLALCEIYEVP